MARGGQRLRSTLPRTPEIADAACARLARRQHGVVTLDQARAAGLSQRAIDRRLGSGRWERLHPGVYRVGGAPPSWEQLVLAACLHAGEGSAASHRSAAALWRLAGVDVTIVEIIAPRRARGRGVVVHEVSVPTRQTTTVGVIPVTNPTRTLLDLGAVVNPDVVEQALDDALHRGLTTITKLRGILRRDGGRGRRGAGVLRKLLEARDPRSAPPESVLEARLGRLLARSGLPKATPQYEVRDRGRLVGRVDFAWPTEMVAVEADGYRFHSGARAWRRDRARGNALTGRGWRVFYVTWDDVTRQPERLLAELKRALR